MSSLSTTPTVVMTTAMVTPGAILPGNDFRRAASLLHTETQAAIRDIYTFATNEEAPTDWMMPTTDGRDAVLSALKTLLTNGIATPLRAFHARVVDNAQARRIAKATVEPQLEHAAARIAAVVEAERPANRPTLKGLIHEDVDKTTEGLLCRLQLLEAKLGETKDALKRKKATPGDTARTNKNNKRAKNERGDATKSNKTRGNAVALSTVTPNKNMMWKRKEMKKPTNKPMKSPPTTPVGNDDASTAANKKPRKKATSRKSSGKGRRKPTATRN